MKNLTRKNLDELIQDQYSTCVSFYLPTHRGGMEVLKNEDQIVFKNQLKGIKEKFIERGWQEKNIDEILAPATELLNDSKFWRNQEEGLAIFLTNGVLKYYNLPFKPTTSSYIARGFHLRPLLPTLSGSGTFFALGLNLHHITFYKGNREELNQIPVEELTPQRMEEVVGYDYKERFLQFRSQQEGHGQASFHGHGKWKDEFKKEEILKFFREVNKKIATLIRGQNIPLMIIGQEYLQSIYKKANTYPHLLEEYVDVNPEHVDAEDLHQKVWEKIYVKFNDERVIKNDLIKQFHNTPRVSFDPEEIITEAVNGRVDTLFIQKDTEIWGVYDQTNNRVVIEEEQSLSNVSLVNFGIVEVLKNGGIAYEQIAETMPMPYSKLNALFRY